MPEDFSGLWKYEKKSKLDAAWEFILKVKMVYH